MKFYSTNHTSPSVDFKTALFTSLAPDGGLYMPEEFPSFSQKEIAALQNKSLCEIGEAVLTKWLTDIPKKDIKTIAKKGLAFPIPLKKVGAYEILELFHGPTMAFKDVAAGVLAQIISYYLKKEHRTMTILVATSGDTGGAIAQAFSGVEGVRVVVLFPKGRVSKLQEEQLTRVAENVTPVEVAGDFDACQAYVKQAFLDKDLAGLNLSSANSINIGRLIPQIIYYVWAFVQQPKKPLRFVVPSGNMGSVCAGLFARSMGLPFSSFVIATNENDSVVKYFHTGEFDKQQTKKTLSTAMDIGNPSNFIRILELFKHKSESFRKVVTAVKITDEETKQTITRVHKSEDYIMDFHTAVGYKAAEKLTSKAYHNVILSTASPKKFTEELEQNTGIKIDASSELGRLRKRNKKTRHANNSYQAVKDILISLAD